MRPSSQAHGRANGQGRLGRRRDAGPGSLGLAASPLDGVDDRQAAEAVQRELEPEASRRHALQPDAGGQQPARPLAVRAHGARGRRYLLGPEVERLGVADSSQYAASSDHVS
jgi:hypothetical protein